MARKAKRGIDFESLIAKGENTYDPAGFCAETPAGTAHATGTGWNKDPDYGRRPQVPEGGAWQGGRSNRTGE